MQLSTALLAALIGGQLEIQQAMTDLIFRGEIKSAAVEGDELTVRFVWLAKNDGTFMQPSTEWTMTQKFDFKVRLSGYEVSDMGDGQICLSSLATGETMSFFPKGYNGVATYLIGTGGDHMLDRERVKPAKIVLIRMGGLTAFDSSAIGTKVVRAREFVEATVAAIAAHDSTTDEVPGQHEIMCDAVIPYVSAGIGRRTKRPTDYVLREHRGNVDMFLRREFAAEAESCKLIVYTREAYLRDPEVMADAQETARIVASDATHVLVAVLAFAGPDAPLSPYRLVSNLAGGNKKAEQWTADVIRAEALASKTYHDEWCVVADAA